MEKSFWEKLEEPLTGKELLIFLFQVGFGVAMGFTMGYGQANWHNKIDKKAFYKIEQTEICQDFIDTKKRRYFEDLILKTQNGEKIVFRSVYNGAYKINPLGLNGKVFSVIRGSLEDNLDLVTKDNQRFTYINTNGCERYELR